MSDSQHDAGHDGFLLSRHWRDSPAGIELEFWLYTADGPLQCLVPAQQAVFFLPREQRPLVAALLQSMTAWQCRPLALSDFCRQPVDGHYFARQQDLRSARELLQAAGLDPLEADINPADRYLMERQVRGALTVQGALQAADGYRRALAPAMRGGHCQPRLKVVSLDIETAMSGLQLYCIGLYASSEAGELRKVLMVSNTPLEGIDCYASELELLRALFVWLRDWDPDVIIGWNVVNFDLWFLEQLCRRHRLTFTLGRAGSAPLWRELDDDGERRALSVAGRVVLDGIDLLKMAGYNFASFALDAVARQVLGEGKLLAGGDRGEQIGALYRADPQALAAYNLQDCQLVWDIVERLRLLDFALARSELTGLPLARSGGSVAAFDFRYLPLLHRRGFVAPNGHLQAQIESSPGGYVMDSRPGLYRHVLVLDFKSLYPSIIRTFQIDPLALVMGMTAAAGEPLVEGFSGARFAADYAILPGIIAELWSARDAAKQARDAPLSQAIKILMNSFYGVLGSGGCRFFDARLASSITRRGHQIIQQTAAFIEQQGYGVIYGDTDSVFVWLQQVQDDAQAAAVGRQLATQLNSWWQQRLADEYGLQSVLEIQFETHYRHFLMPTVRGSELGSKKRYAGVVVKNGEPQLIFKGLESARSDWTELAQTFQHELYRRIFFGEPYADYIATTVARLRAGACDGQLRYRKRLRRRLEDYQRNVPPHVQAARKLAQSGAAKPRRGDWIDYVMTRSGPEPCIAGELTVVPDYQHYVDRQLAPIADSILHFVGTCFSDIVDRQLSLF